MSSIRWITELPLTSRCRLSQRFQISLHQLCFGAWSPTNGHKRDQTNKRRWHTIPNCKHRWPTTKTLSCLKIQKNIYKRKTRLNQHEHRISVEVSSGCRKGSFRKTNRIIQHHSQLLPFKPLPKKENQESNLKLIILMFAGSGYPFQIRSMHMMQSHIGSDVETFRDGVCMCLR